ncbi:hypothetical protein K1X45_05755 [Pseudochrobactrum sp. Wa41.01b-1]|uniref:hypothetical protein n=1 Tax=Pseudochrobactrum sp. Wa41.01b-1 TaxID=2864102 RepID=UPI001C6891CC|nr:hypothetical protein [Pseudochrobactrum sp. Wa41.01b-1]QYM73910.1 hypothetical protein K1X45_05755 [Pseudochrobactrum sp. Wa41.01b-1]
MDVSKHPIAIDHVPAFITAPGQTDILFNFVIVFLICMIFAVGTLYLRLHALPEQMAHRTNKVQLQVVAVLALIALFTHNQLFWIAALLLAMIELPNFITPVTSMAKSLNRIARSTYVPQNYPPASVPAAQQPAPVAEAAAKPVEPVQPQAAQDGHSSHNPDQNGEKQ